MGVIWKFGHFGRYPSIHLEVLLYSRSLVIYAFLMNMDKKVGLCVNDSGGSMSLLANTRLSQPWRSCGSSEFHMKNNLIEKLLLPSASWRHSGHTQQHSAVLPACGRLHRAANKGCVHVSALGNEDTELSISAATIRLHILFSLVLRLKAMNQHLCGNLNFGFAKMLYFCNENMQVLEWKMQTIERRIKVCSLSIDRSLVSKLG